MSLPETPELGQRLPSAHPSDDTLKLLALRRSTPVELIGEPGPSAEVLADILRIGARVSDHRRVKPFRFIIFEGNARAKVGPALATSYRANEPDANGARVSCERDRFLRAPMVIGVVSSVVKNHRTPEWEQVMTAGAVCQNMLIAASASGFAAQWLTEWYAFDRPFLTSIGLEEEEKIAGFIYVGTAKESPPERPRPEWRDLVTRFGA